MAGGSGTRFWPESVRARPKQFLRIAGDDSMIALTALRLLGAVPKESIYVVTHVSQAALAAEALAPLGVPARNVIPEPHARNTAACVGLAARILDAIDPEATFAVLPADHVIRPRERFEASLQKALHLAEAGGLYTFGIQPTYPATGYGYIQYGPRLDRDDTFPLHAIASFKEKPVREVAESFLAEGGYAWNSGMFVWRARAILDELSQHAPELARGLAALPIGADPATWSAVPPEAYGALPALPIDMAVMEKSRDGRVLLVDYEWNDVGSWVALDALHAADDRGNRAVFPAGGELITIDAENVLGFSTDERLIAVIGMRDVVVVHAERATLVVPKHRSEDVKLVVDHLKSRPELDGFL